MNADAVLLFTTRLIRLFAYGFLSVVLALYLGSVGLSEQEIGLLLSLTLLGDAGVTLWITTSADRIGRRRMLLLGAVLMIFAGLVFAFTNNLVLLIVAAIIGVISPSGNEIGPFLSIEQASLSQLVADEKRTKVFAWYTLVGSFATGCGALAGGVLAQGLQANGFTEVDSYRWVLVAYSLCGLILAVCFFFLTPSIEVTPLSASPTLSMGLHKSRGVVLKLSSLFALDAFGGGFVVQSIMAYWFHLRFGADIGLLGSLFFGANVLAGVSTLVAVWLARKIGLVNTMVFTHIPSNVLLCLVPAMPTLELAIAVLLVRFSISQMDVPTRQSYTMAVVDPGERSAASGVTTIARSIGAAISPALSGVLLATPALVSAPFLFAGGLKIVYDVLLYRSFKAIKPPEESTS